MSVMTDQENAWHAEALDAAGDPLGAPLTDPAQVVDHLTARSLAHNIQYALLRDAGVKDTVAEAQQRPQQLVPDPSQAVHQAIRHASLFTSAETRAPMVREGLRVWVELYYPGDRDLTSRTQTALGELGDAA
jgi:hypothetical protein